MVQNYNCKHILNDVKDEVRTAVEDFRNVKNAPKPIVEIIMSDYDEPSERYVRNKVKDLEEVGIQANVLRFESMVDLIAHLKKSKRDPSITGTIIQRPISFNGVKLDEAGISVVNDYIHPLHDIDGVLDDSIYRTACVGAIDILFDYEGIDPEGMKATVIGRGEVGLPVAEYLLKRNATVTVCHSKTSEGLMKDELFESDIVVGAAGLKKPINFTVNSGDIHIVDFGITKGADGKLHGDIGLVDSINNGLISRTTVPGGMGLLVRAALLKNILMAYRLQY